MSTLPQEGLYAYITIGTTPVAFLTEVTLSISRDYKEWVTMGSLTVSDVLQGAVKVKGNCKAAYIDNTFIDYVWGGSTLTGSILPRGTVSGTHYISGSLQFVNCNITNMKQEEANAVLNECDFIIYNITKA